MERALASVQRILAVDPIPGADAIEVATVKGWKVVIKRGEYVPGDAAIYFEIDSLLPVREAYEFLRKSSYKRLADGTEGFRLRTIKLRGQLSQGLLMPLSVLPELPHEAVEGLDVTEALGVIKYEPPVPADLAGQAKGYLPGFLVKTDEERVQNLPELFDAAQHPDVPLYVTEKLDGSSATFFLKDDVFGVCSRNLELYETPGSAFWRVARALRLEEGLRTLGSNVALQGELLGPGVQGNRYRLPALTVRFFSLYHIDTRRFDSLEALQRTLALLGLDAVPVLDEAFLLPDTVDAMLAYAEGRSTLCPDVAREGVVVRSPDRAISFKAISNGFLLAEG